MVSLTDIVPGEAGEHLAQVQRKLSAALFTAYRQVAQQSQEPVKEDVPLAPGASCSVLHTCIARLGTCASGGGAKQAKHNSHEQGMQDKAGSARGGKEAAASGTPERNRRTEGHRSHEHNISMLVPCPEDCLIEGCTNKLKIDCVRARSMVLGQQGLFAVRDLPAGTFLASYGPVVPVAAHTRPRETKLGYKFKYTPTGRGSAMWVTPRHGSGTKHKAHAINHECSEMHANARIVHSGATVKNIQMLVQSKIDIRENDEIFVRYGEVGTGIHEYDMVCVCYECSRPDRHKTQT